MSEGGWLANQLKGPNCSDSGGLNQHSAGGLGLGYCLTDYKHELLVTGKTFSEIPFNKKDCVTIVVGLPTVKLIQRVEIGD